jgi:hypothetical protein
MSQPEGRSLETVRQLVAAFESAESAPALQSHCEPPLWRSGSLLMPSKAPTSQRTPKSGTIAKARTGNVPKSLTFAGTEKN